MNRSAKSETVISDGWLTIQLVVLGLGLVANSLLGPLVSGAIEYRFSDTLIFQGMGLDFVSLTLVAPLCLQRKAHRRNWRVRSPGDRVHTHKALDCISVRTHASVHLWDILESRSKDSMSPRSSQDARRFDWDRGNSEKNWIRHRVSQKECEAVFFNRPLVVHEDLKHSRGEDRFYALGRTDEGRHLFVVYTFREDAIRVISARDMTSKERRIYSHAEIEGLEDNS